MRSLFWIALFLLLPSPAWAFVPHGYPGIFIHQMGHVFFIISCLFVMWTIFKNRLHKEKGWRYLFTSQILFIAWNVDTFIGHITEYWIEESQIIGTREGWGYFWRDIVLEGWDHLYYITKFDHLYLVPAMLLFYQGLVEHLREEGKGATAAAAVLPLFPVVFIDVAGSVAMIVLSFFSLCAAIKLYRTNRENTLWNYVLWLSATYVIFALSRSMGHILQRVLVPTGNEQVWRQIEPFSGSLNTFTFIVIGSVSLFFSKVYAFYRELFENKRRIEAINADLTELNQELETLVAERTMSLMALTVADRVRNPAAVIGWTCQRILEKEKVSERLGENLKDIVDESKKLETIVKDFETLLKSKQSIFRYEDINEIIRGVVPIVEKEAIDKGITIRLGLSDQPIKINTQKNLLRAAIFHIIRNAIEATPSGGTITITTSGDHTRAVLTISDTGAGISPEDRDKIFDPFFSTKRYRFGMGLPLVRQIVSEHLGEIEIQSEEGKGTSFIITFPVRWLDKK
ncbi:MAG: HAMP domain-containing sensor histidine kinase [Nitrospirota bacterium]